MLEGLGSLTVTMCLSNVCVCVCVCVCACACVCVFTDSREETVLGSIPLPSYVITPVDPDDHISRKYAFKVTPS